MCFKYVRFVWHVNLYTGTRGLQEKYCKAKHDCFAAPGQTKTSLKIEDLRSNKTTGKLS
jgi:hypothetical protein